MRDRGLRALPWLALAVSVGAAILLIGGGEDPVPPEPPAPLPVEAEPRPPQAEETAETDGRAGRVDVSAPPGRKSRRAPGPAGAERAYRVYIDAINARDGEQLLALLGRDGVEALELPVERGEPAERLSGSIGYRDPRGFPVWEATTLASIDSARELPSGVVQVTATIVTDFADRPEPSVETDVAYFAGDGRLVKPSAAIHRAVGKPDVPPSVIAEP